MNDDDLDLLVAHRPHPDPPSRTSTDRVRASLLAHGARRRRTRRRTGTLAAAGIVAAATAVVVLTDGVTGRVGFSQSQRAIAITPPAPAVVAHRTVRVTLVTLAADVLPMRSRLQSGNATLVVRYTVINGRHEVDGAIYGGYDLYTDTGRYYYAPDSLGQLQQQVNTRQAVFEGGNEAKTLDTIAAASRGTPAQARASLLSTVPGTNMAQAERQFSTLPEPRRREFLAALHDHKPADGRRADDSSVYDTATLALAVGAGRPAVRAGAMKALSTIAGIRQTRVRVDGIAALKIEFADSGQPEIIWLDATTGVPIQERDSGGSATSYKVERVTAARLPSRIPSNARLR